VGVDNSATIVGVGNSGEGCCVGVGKGGTGVVMGVGEVGTGVIVGVGNTKGPQANITINSTSRARKRILVFIDTHPILNDSNK